MSVKKIYYRIILVLGEDNEIVCPDTFFDGVGKQTAFKKQAFKNLNKLKKIIKTGSDPFISTVTIKDCYIRKTTKTDERL